MQHIPTILLNQCLYNSEMTIESRFQDGSEALLYTEMNNKSKGKDPIYLSASGS